VIEIQVKKRYHGDAFFGRPRGPRVRGRWVWLHPPPRFSK
jgi:hypothetical protein